MEELYKDAFSEVFFILNKLQLRNRIPNNFVNFIQKNRNINYNPKFSDDVIFHPEMLKLETREILSLIYRSYLCSDDEKMKLLKDDEIKIKNENEIFTKNETINNQTIKIETNKNEIVGKEIAKDENNIKENKTDSNMQLIDTSKMNFFKKIYLKIKSFFKRSK